MDLGLGGKVALVAGASAGLGYAAARALAAEGARVMLASRSQARVTEAARRITEETGSPAAGVELDVTQAEAGPRFVAAARERFGPPAILITNAGGPTPGPFAKLALEDFERTLELTFLSAVRLTHAALPFMKEAGWGRIVHITSSTVFEPAVGLFLSSAVRPAVVGFSKTLSREVAPFGITVNVVSPGVIATDRLQELAEFRAGESGRTVEQEFAAMAASAPVGRLGRPEELGWGVAFLCSERASYITGVSLRIDGGKVASLL